LRLLPLLEDAAYQLSLRDMAACFIGLFQFMPIYFTAKGSGYNVQHDAIGVMRVMFIHEADIKPITPPVA
jgi:hypothetical protein